MSVSIFSESKFCFHFLSSYEHGDTMDARKRMEEQFRQQQQMASSAPPQAVPESKPIPGMC